MQGFQQQQGLDPRSPQKVFSWKFCLWFKNFWEKNFLGNFLYLTFMKLSKILFEGEEDYRGEHTAPGKEGAPLWDVTMNGVYPADFYSVNGARYYGDGSSGDVSVVGLISSFRNKPKGKVKIYRAVPDEPTLQAQVDDFESQKKYILKYNKIPRNIDTPLNPNEYYKHIHDVVERLKERIAGGEKDKAGIDQINVGDWVTIYRPYAVDHGKGALNGQYKILSKTVKASELFTDGNSIYEWGYVP